MERGLSGAATGLLIAADLADSLQARDFGRWRPPLFLDVVIYAKPTRCMCVCACARMRVCACCWVCVWCVYR